MDKKTTKRDRGKWASPPPEARKAKPLNLTLEPPVKAIAEHYATDWGVSLSKAISRILVERYTADTAPKKST